MSNTKKLRLTMETVRILDPDQLADVNGGDLTDRTNYQPRPLQMYTNFCTWQGLLPPAAAPRKPAPQAKDCLTGVFIKPLIM